ncbi:MAG: MopE-related protein [Persicimonas sp.]
MNLHRLYEPFVAGACIAGLCLSCMAFGCGETDSPTEDEQAPDAGQDEDADAAPAREECDGTDTDGDGVVDEGCECDYLQSSLGVCADSQISDETGECQEPDDYETDESTCDGLDNDCDGVVDEGCECNYDDAKEGVCGEAVVDDDSGDCLMPEAFEEDEETCDGRDNDCDGVVDEGCECDYDDTDKGVCADATIDADSGECTEPDAYEEDESSCDGYDNDCDGVVDEGCPCPVNGVYEGVCSDGTMSEEGECEPPEEYEEVEQSCDGLDNDCDGYVDNFPGDSEDFENPGDEWYTYEDGSGSINADPEATDHAYEGDQAGKAWGSDGACGVGGLAKDYSFQTPPGNLTMMVRASTSSWGRFTILLIDSEGEHVLHREKAGGSAISMDWTEMEFDLSDYEPEFTLVIGNDDDSQNCGNFDHTWDVWVDDLEMGSGIEEECDGGDADQ